MTHKYPVEAFTLIMVLMTTSVSNAIVVGSLTIFGTLAGMLTRLILGEDKKMQEVEMMISFFIVFGAIYLTETYIYGIPDSWDFIFAVAANALLVTKFVTQIDVSMVNDFKGVLLSCLNTFVVMLVIAVIRELMGQGTFLGYTLIKGGLVSTGFSHTFFGFVLTSFGLAFINEKSKTDCTDIESAMVVVPAAVISAPFTISAVPAPISIMISILLVSLYLVSVKGRLVFSDTSKSMSGLPVELLALGVVYMILSFF